MSRIQGSTFTKPPPEVPFPDSCRSFFDALSCETDAGKITGFNLRDLESRGIDTKLLKSAGDEWHGLQSGHSSTHALSAFEVKWISANFLRILDEAEKIQKLTNSSRGNKTSQGSGLFSVAFLAKCRADFDKFQATAQGSGASLQGSGASIQGSGASLLGDVNILRANMSQFQTHAFNTNQGTMEGVAWTGDSFTGNAYAPGAMKGGKKTVATTAGMENNLLVNIPPEVMELLALQQQEIDTLKDQVDELTREKQANHDKIAQLMNQKISEDETDLENISDKTRPSKVREAYKSIQTEEWLRAKQALEKKFGKKDNIHQYQYLLDVMAKCFGYAQTRRLSIFEKLPLLLKHPFTQLGEIQPILEANRQNIGGRGAIAKQPGAGHSSTPQHGQEELPKELVSGSVRYLRTHSDEPDVSACVDMVERNLTGIDRKYSEYNQAAGVHPYISVTFRLAWKMVLQTPQMSFYFPRPGDTFDPNLCEPHGLSQDPSKFKTIVSVIYPALYHGAKLVDKASVICGKQ